MFDLYIFDLDGTVIDSLESIANCFNSVLKEYGYDPIPLKEFNYFIGDGAPTLTRRSLDYVFDRDNVKNSKSEREEFFEEYFPVYFKKYTSMDDTTTHLYKGIRESLDHLKKQGKKIAICTNKPIKATENILAKLLPKDYFDMVVGLDDVRTKKPDPSMVYEIMEHFNIERDKVAYFGDTSTDMMTAHNADVYAVGVTWGIRPKSELEQYKADRIIEDPLEIMTI